MIIQSHHQSAALAERKRSELEKKYFIVRLLSRRNDKGNFSNRGHNFIWEVFDKPKGKRIELVLHFDYGDEGGKNTIRFQVHVFGPSEATDSEAISAVRKLEKGERPKGWKFKEIFWSHPPGHTPRGPIGEEDAEKLASARRAAIGAPSEVRVTRKNPISRDRRANRKTKRKENIS